VGCVLGVGVALSSRNKQVPSHMQLVNQASLRSLNFIGNVVERHFGGTLSKGFK
jgi:hypothetical protein